MVTKRQAAKAMTQWERTTRQWAANTGRALALDLYHHRPAAIRPYDIGVVLDAGETIWAQVPVVFNQDQPAPGPAGPNPPASAIRPWLVTSQRVVARLGDGFLHGYRWDDMVGVRLELAAGREALVVDIVGQPSLVWSGPGLAPMAVTAVFHLYGAAALLDHPGLDPLRTGQDWAATASTAGQPSALTR